MPLVRPAYLCDRMTVQALPQGGGGYLENCPVPTCWQYATTKKNQVLAMTWQRVQCKPEKRG